MPGEPVDLLAAYKAALESGGLSACAPLLKLLEDAAENDTPIASLNLREAGLGSAGAAALAAMVQRDSFLTYVNLEENELGDDGAAHVADALCRHPAVFRLDLGYNKIAGRGVKALAGLLAESPSLLCLDLSGNNLYSRLSMFGPASYSALAPIGVALGAESCKLQLLHLDFISPSITSLPWGIASDERGRLHVVDHHANCVRTLEPRAAPSVRRDAVADG